LQPDMNEIRKKTIARMNELGAQGKPFAFLIDFDFEKPLIFDVDNSLELQWETPGKSNFKKNKTVAEKNIEWKVEPVAYEVYQSAFDLVQKHIHSGDTYLLNLTMPSKVETNLSPEEIFHLSVAPYKIWLKDRFVCFSPEIFVRINDGIISSYPMKGTIDATIENAAELLLQDEKEVAEHHTIVDLIRNDLSIIASEVQVDRLMYIDRIKTNQGELLQMSSQISGKLETNYAESIGTIFAELLPAGSICGAPKHKTVEIIRNVEPHVRGYYTGIFGIFDGRNIDSCVLIRYLEQNGSQLTFKSGGGITFLSDCQTEYNEIIQKVYVPIS
jgi:para-aminobenzoate synthetase component 1